MNKPLNIQLWPVGNIIPYDLNAKKHEPEQVAKIAKAITQFGWDVPIVVDKNGVIIKGHGRRLAALELGLEKVPVLIRADLTPEQVRAARLADNRVAVSDLDPEKLRAELENLDYDLTGIFDAKELDFMNVNLGEMKLDIFVDDMDKTVSDQKADLDRRIDGVAKGSVPLHKAFGFKDVAGSSQIVITQFMAIAEANTGKVGSEALIEYIQKELLEA